MGLGVLDGVQLVGITDITVVGLTANDPVPTVEGQIDASNGYRTLHLIIRLTITLEIIGEGVMGGVTIVAAHSEAQSVDGVIVNTTCKAVLVGGLELKRRAGTVVNPLVAVKEHGIQTSHHHHLIFQLAAASPERKTRIVPGRGEDGVLALRTIHREIVQRLVLRVVQSYGHDDMSELQVGSLRELLVDPELLQFHLTTFLLLILPFGSLVGLVLDGRAGTGMFELDLRSHGPPLTEVVPEVDHRMGDVELPMTRIILVVGRGTVTVHMVAEELTGITDLPVATYTQFVTFRMLHHAVAGMGLCHDRNGQGRECHHTH